MPRAATKEKTTSLVALSNGFRLRRISWALMAAEGSPTIQRICSEKGQPSGPRRVEGRRARTPLRAAAPTSHFVHEGIHRPSGNVARKASKATPARDPQKPARVVGVIDPTTVAIVEPPGRRFKGANRLAPRAARVTAARGARFEASRRAMRRRASRKPEEYGDSEHMENTLGCFDQAGVKQHRQFVFDLWVHCGRALCYQPGRGLTEQGTDRGQRDDCDSQDDRQTDPPREQRRSWGQGGHPESPIFSMSARSSPASGMTSR